MAVGGPNSRKDYHHDPERGILLPDRGRHGAARPCRTAALIDVPIREGEMFLLPAEVPHSPQRPAGSVGHRGRAAPRRRRNWTASPGTARTAAIACIWSGSRCSDIETQLPEIFSRFYSSIAHRTCSVCGTVMQAPASDRASGSPDAARARWHWMRAIRLAAFAHEFHHPHEPHGRRLVYLCGHSLGSAAQVRGAVRRAGTAATGGAWACSGITRPTRPWIGYHEQAAAPPRRLGRRRCESEVVAMNSLTVNLHLMMVSFFRPDARAQQAC